MKLIISLFLLLLITTGCMQTDNSSSYDRTLYGEGAVGGTAQFQAASTALATHCASCHAYHTYTQAELIARGLVSAGSLANSKIYYRLKNATSGPGPKDMPQGVGAIPTNDLNAISDFILGL